MFSLVFFVFFLCARKIRLSSHSVPGIVVRVQVVLIAVQLTGVVQQIVLLV